MPNTSFERTRHGSPLQAFISFWALRGLPWRDLSTETLGVESCPALSLLVTEGTHAGTIRLYEAFPLGFREKRPAKAGARRQL